MFEKSSTATEYIGGIPEWVLSTSGDGTFQTMSGQTLYFHNSERVFDIYDQTRTYEVAARLNPDNYLVLHLFTKNPRDKSQRHPDLFAKKLVLAMAAKFHERGLVIKGLNSVTEFSGMYASEIAAQFLKARREGLEPEAAARTTWSWQLAQELGFSQVKTVEVSADSINMVFTA